MRSVEELEILLAMARCKPDPDSVKIEILCDLIEAVKKLGTFYPKPHWSTESETLIKRLRGIYPLGPLLSNGTPEFGYRYFQGLPPIQIEAAKRIQDLEEQVDALKEQLENKQ